MKIEIKSLTVEAGVVLKKYSSMKQRGVTNVWKEEEKTLFMKFPPLSSVERLKSMYVDFIDEQLLKEGLTKEDYEVKIK